ncbi:uncharacterized protein LOC110355492 isoform X3 [Columba livia]|uniref:uncharacterized protein LOC110355492 isoform X3 n=1 Tax=Columba livia TaxID=8932 RepID=UPI0031BBC837
MPPGPPLALFQCCSSGFWAVWACSVQAQFGAVGPPALAPMDAPTVTRAPGRAPLLQLLRSLFGLLRGTREPHMEGQELGAVGDSSGPGELAGQQHPHWEPWEGESMEPLLGELSLAGSLGSSSSRSCVTLSTSDMEMAVASDGGDSPAGSPARQRAGLAGEEGTAMLETFSSKALETDGLLQGPGADGEDVTSSASPELMFSMDFDTEWEKEQLLKADEAAGSPKAELSSWNRLFNVNRLRGSSHKYGAPGRLMEPESKEQPLSDAANPSAAALGERRSKRNPLAALGEAGNGGEQAEQEPLEKAEVQLPGAVGSSP